LTTSASTNSEGIYNKDGSLQTFKVKALARSYMQRTQGTPTKMNFDTDTSAFTFDFEVNCDLEYPSVGFFSQEYWYENGLTYTLTASDGTELKSPDDFTAEYKDNYLGF